MSSKGTINGQPPAANVRQFVSVKVAQVFKKFVLVFKIMCTCLFTRVQVPMEAKRGVRDSPGAGCVLGTNLEPSSEPSLQAQSLSP